MFVVQISRADARDGVLNPTTRSRAMHLASFAEPYSGEKNTLGKAGIDACVTGKDFKHPKRT